jgi:hypothetical protein
MVVEPMCAVRPDPYVPNDIAFEPRGLRTMCLSGANMGGALGLGTPATTAGDMAHRQELLCPRSRTSSDHGPVE